MTLARLNEALRDEPPQRVLACTYGFDPAFFEQEILPAILPSLPEARGAGNTASYLNGGDTAIRTCPITVCCDHSEPGRDLPYEIVRVRTGGGAFHPKLLLLDYGDIIRAVVSSVNLTRSGWSSALEMFIFEDLEVDGTHPWAAALAKFLRGIQRMVAPAQRDQLEPAVKRIASIGAPRMPTRRRIPELFSTFDGSLLEAALAARPKATEIHAVTPFLEGEGGSGVFDRLESGLPRARGVLYLRAEEADGAPIVRGPEDKLRTLLDGGKWEFRRVASAWPGDTDGAPPRQLHGKMLALRKGRRASVLVGSANVTRAALLGRTPHANVELCALLDVSTDQLNALLPESSRLVEDGLRFEPAPDEKERDLAADWVKLAAFDCRKGELEIQLHKGTPRLVVLYAGATIGSIKGAGWSGPLELGRSLEVVLRSGDGREASIPFLLLNIAALPPRGLSRPLRLDELLEVMAGSREPTEEEGDARDSLGPEGPNGASAQLGTSTAFAWRKLIRALAGLERDLIGAAAYPIEIERLLDGPLGANGLLEMLDGLGEKRGFLSSDRAFVVHQLRLTLRNAQAAIAASEAVCPKESTAHLNRWSKALKEQFAAIEGQATESLAAQLKLLRKELARGGDRG